jgi:hypothetical protein
LTSITSGALAKLAVFVEEVAKAVKCGSLLSKTARLRERAFLCVQSTADGLRYYWCLFRWIEASACVLSVVADLQRLVAGL